MTPSSEAPDDIQPHDDVNDVSGLPDDSHVSDLAAASQEEEGEQFLEPEPDVLPEAPRRSGRSCPASRDEWKQRHYSPPDFRYAKPRTVQASTSSSADQPNLTVKESTSQARSSQISANLIQVLAVATEVLDPVSY